MRARRPKTMPKGAVVSVNLPGKERKDTYCRVVAEGSSDESIRAALDRLLADKDAHVISLARTPVVKQTRERKRLDQEDSERAQLIGAAG